MSLTKQDKEAIEDILDTDQGKVKISTNLLSKLYHSVSQAFDLISDLRKDYYEMVGASLIAEKLVCYSEDLGWSEGEDRPANEDSDTGKSDE